MEKRSLVALALSFAVLFLWTKYFSPKPVKQEVPVQQEQILTKEVFPETPQPTRANEVSATDSDAGEFQQSALIGPEKIPTPEPVERTIRIQSNRFDAELSTRGARIKSWKLKEFKDLEGNPLQLISDDNPKFFPGDLMIGEDESLNNLVYNYSDAQDQIVLTESNPKQAVDVMTVSGDGFEVKKTFTFFHDKDIFSLDVIVTNVSAERKEGILCLPLPDQILTAKGIGTNSSYMRSGPILSYADKRDEPKIGKFPTRWVYPDPIRWVANQKSYFFISAIPAINFSKGFIQPTRFDEKKRPTHASLGLMAGAGPLLPNDRVIAQFIWIMGPKKYQELKSLNLGIEKIVNFGWIEWLGYSFYYILIHTAKYVNNYGLSIIILTIGIKIILFPLSHISMKSMKKMQEIQPLVKDLQARYKKEPQKLQQEMSQLYRKHGVNPMGGCLPLVIQFPVFIALYQVLYNAIEMRGTSFLWAKDLAQPDIPLVLIMGVSMLIQQKMTPTGGDPRQARMMMFMPIIFTAMFWKFPSGLVLYWLVNNILTIAQQYLMNAKPKDKTDSEQGKVKSRVIKKLASK